MMLKKNENALKYLTDLLFSGDMNIQSCAVGSLINILGINLKEDSEERSKLLRTLSGKAY
jgi:hypothetical protein